VLTPMFKKLVPMVVVALVAAIALVPGTAVARGCHANFGSAAVKANVSCHLTNVVVEKITPKITRETQSFRVYASGWWHCETAPIEEFHAIVCMRHSGLISIVTE
jgi:hypothetical protein